MTDDTEVVVRIRATTETEIEPGVRAIRVYNDEGPNNKRFVSFRTNDLPEYITAQIEHGDLIVFKFAESSLMTFGIVCPCGLTHLNGGVEKMFSLTLKKAKKLGLVKRGTILVDFADTGVLCSDLTVGGKVYELTTPAVLKAKGTTRH